MKRMRTLSGLVAHYKNADVDTAVTAHFLRQKILAGEIPSVRAGKKRLIAIEDVDIYLAGDKPAPTVESGKIRRVV